MRSKLDILKWVEDSKSTAAEGMAIIELLADIRDLLTK